MKKIHVRKITVALLSAISIIMLVACLNEFYCDEFYCDLCGSMHNDGKANYICVGSVDVTICDEHKAQFFKSTEKMSVDEMTSIVAEDGILLLKTLSEPAVIGKTEKQFFVNDKFFDTEEDFKKFVRDKLCINGDVYIMTE